MYFVLYSVEQSCYQLMWTGMDKDIEKETAADRNIPLYQILK